MKVLHSLAQLPTRTGSGVYYRNLIREFKQKTDWEQIALYAKPQDLTVDWLAADYEYAVNFESPELPFPIAGMSDVMPYPSTIYHKLEKDQLASWKQAFLKQLEKIKQEQAPELIIAHHLWILTRLLEEVFPEVPIVAISHGTDLRQALQNPGLASKEVGSLDGLDKVFALSSLHIDDIHSLFGVPKQKLIVTGGAFDQELFYPDDSKPELGDEPRRDFRFVYAGKLSEAKGTFELIKAFHRLSKRGLKMRLDLIGQLNPEVEAILNAEPDAKIRVYDVASQEALAAELRTADCFVFPSYFEGLGLIALEALASGLRMVVNELPTLQEQLNDKLLEHPWISWVPLPELEHIDQPKKAAIPGYVESLAEAMLEQYEAAKEGPSDSPMELVLEHSWDRLSDRILNALS
ncbi:MAG: glycosyltransferase family 4 protein [Eubacteriales bacterium]|nr:glycosyltransferase family 4 protein [Eubacteriales bacterium]